MKDEDIKIMAETLGINTEGRTLSETIREIQRREGNFDCFGTAFDFCDQTECLYRELCIQPSPQNLVPFRPPRMYYSTKYEIAGMPFLGKITG